MITNRFSKDAPVSMTQGRHGELIVVQGGGVRPARWDGSGPAVDAGMDAPTSAPAVSASGNVKYYVARVDITKPGACYYAPPEVTFTAEGPPGRAATAASYLSQASVGEIRVLDGGKFYSSPPTVTLSDTHGKGAVIEAVLDTPEDAGVWDDPTNSKKTGITGWDVAAGPPFEDELDLEPLFKTKWRALGPISIPVANGSGRIQKRIWYSLGSCAGFLAPAYYYVDLDIPYTISGVKNGTGAVLRVGFSGHVAPVGTGCISPSPNQCVCGVNDWLYSWGVSGVTPSKYGSNYADDETITVTIAAYSSWDGETQKYVPAPASKSVVIRGYTGGNPMNSSGERYSLRSLRLVDGGSGYLVAPQIKITSNSGFGAYATCEVADGKIVSVTLENSGGGYKSVPKVEIVSGGAEAFAVSRPHLRGTYQCYYRFVDDTPEDKGGPIPSNLSPLTEIDVGEGSGGVVWDIPAPTGRATKVELWRSTSNQATTLYRVAVLGVNGEGTPDYTPLRIILAPTNRIFQNSATVLVAIAGGASVVPSFVWEERAPGGEWSGVPSPSLQIVPANDGSYSCLWTILSWSPQKSGWEVRAVITRGTETVTTQPVTVTYHSG